MLRRWRFAPACLALALAGVLPSSTASAAEHYYVLVFGSQGHPKQFRYTHTWATFVRAVGEGTDPNGYALEALTISWLPRTLEVDVWDLRPEPGVNLDLEQSLRLALSTGQSVTMWGPFVTGPRVFEKARQVQGIIASGRARYRAISTRYNLLVADCIHAVAAVDPDFGREHYPLIRVGKPASRYIAREVVTRSAEQGIYQHLYDHTWLIPRLGLDRYPIEVVPPQHIPLRRCLLCKHPE